MNEFDAMELVYLRELMPNILFNKLIKLNLTTIGKVRLLSLEEFRRSNSVGRLAERSLLTFKNLIDNDPNKVLTIYNQNCPKTLPFVFDEHDNFLQVLKSLIEDFLSLKENHKHKTAFAKKMHIRNIDVIRKFYGLQSKKYDIIKIATRHRIDRERARQIVMDEFIPEIKNLLNGAFLEKWKCKCKFETVELLQSCKKDFAGTSVLSEHKINLWLTEFGLNLESFDFKNYFNILLNAWGYEKIAISRHNLLHDNVFYADKSIDQIAFLEISDKIINLLMDKVIPIPFDDIVIKVLEDYNVDDDFIKLLCDVNYNIEKLENGLYQLKFEKLTSVNDFVYRILYEKRKELSCNELLHLINRRLVNVNKEITLESLKNSIRKHDYIVPIGKTGVWTLKDFNTNVESQINLILKTFRKVDGSLTVNEITQYINESFRRNDVTARSVGSNIFNYRKHFIKLKNNRFALAETAEMYADEIVKFKTHIKKKINSKSDKIALKVIEILKKSPNNKIKLKELTKILKQTNNDYATSSVYKSITENPLLFKKEISAKKEKFVALFSNFESTENELGTKYKWNDLKKILERELNSIFNSPIQPSYPITLSVALDTFFKLIVLDVSKDCPELADLADRILPTLNKFYIGASDRNDKLNYLKQIVTSQESYFKKLLYIVNGADYFTIRSDQKKGFGSVLSKLSKIDTRENHYKEIKSASNFEFGKHCSRAYSHRNLDTHNAKSWTESEIIETKTSCLVFMVYGVYEYYDKLK